MIPFTNQQKSSTIKPVIQPVALPTSRIPRLLPKTIPSKVPNSEVLETGDVPTQYGRIPCGDEGSFPNSFSLRRCSFDIGFMLKSNVYKGCQIMQKMFRYTLRRHCLFFPLPYGRACLRILLKVQSIQVILAIQLLNGQSPPVILGIQLFKVQFIQITLSIYIHIDKIIHLPNKSPIYLIKLAIYLIKVQFTYISQPFSS